MNVPKLGLCLAAMCVWAEAQTPDPKLTFDVASIKAAALPTPNGRGMIRISPPSGGPGTKDPGRVRYPFTTLRNLIMIAYDVKGYQISGPPVLDSEHFELQATMPPETTKEQFKVMLLNLLAERFLLKSHAETKELPMYSMVVGKKGAKLKESGDTPPLDPDAPPPPMPNPGQMKIGADGFPILPMMGGGRGGIAMMMMPNRARLMAQHSTMEELSARLTSILDRPVQDETDLKGKYEFTLTYSPEGLNSGIGRGGMGGGPIVMAPTNPPPPPPGGTGSSTEKMPDFEIPPDLFTAIQAQLGLKLDAKKGPVEMRVIEHIEKAPTAN
jgi:uncharacterized protein (TIGR03435 family)